MKKLLLLLCLFLSFSLYAQNSDDEVKASKGGISEIPAAKRPKPVDKEKAAKAAEKDETEKDYEKRIVHFRINTGSTVGCGAKSDYRSYH